MQSEIYAEFEYLQEQLEQQRLYLIQEGKKGEELAKELQSKEAKCEVLEKELETLQQKYRELNIVMEERDEDLQDKEHTIEVLQLENRHLKVSIDQLKNSLEFEVQLEKKNCLCGELEK